MPLNERFHLDQNQEPGRCREQRCGRENNDAHKPSQRTLARSVCRHIEAPLRGDDVLPPVASGARLDELLAIGIASLEQMQQIQDDTWQGASTDSDDEIDDAVLANLQLPTLTDSVPGGVDAPEEFASPGAMWGLIA